MPFRITKGAPSEKLKRDLSTLLDLPSEKLQHLAHWLGSGTNPIPTTSAEFSRMAESTDLDQRALIDVMAVLRFVMVSWRKLGLTLDDLTADLCLMGFEQNVVDKGTAFFAALEPAKEQFFAVTLRSAIEQAGLPTIDDMSLIWDLRPIFASPVYPIAEGDDTGVTEWISHTNVLIFELNSSRSDGKSEPLSVQLSETDFEELEVAVSRARKQLEAIKSKRLI